MKLLKLAITIMFIFALVGATTGAIISASDEQTFFPCGGDEEFMIMCVGDSENVPIVGSLSTSTGQGISEEIKEQRSLLYLMLIPILMILLLLGVYLKNKRKDKGNS